MYVWMHECMYDIHKYVGNILITSMTVACIFMSIFCGVYPGKMTCEVVGCLPGVDKASTLIFNTRQLQNGAF